MDRSQHPLGVGRSETLTAIPAPLLRQLGVADYVPMSPALARALVEIVHDARRRPPARALSN